MKNLSRYILLGVLLMAGLVTLNGLFIVNETEQVVIIQFGNPVGEPINTPGVHFKIPFIQEARFFEKRYLEWNQVPTADKRFIDIDYYARWQITDPLKFLQRLRDERGGQSRLDDILDGETRNAIADNQLVEVVRSTNREPQENEDFTETDASLDSISVGREAIQRRIVEKANERTADLGIKVLDFRFKRINYVDEVQRSVYNRMISERQRIADKFRSEGEGEASKINGEKDRELKRIQSEAFRQAEEIRGEADAEAAAVYANAYNRNSTARELYQFLRTMEAYENTFDTQTSVIISSESDFYKYLTKMRK